METPRCTKDWIEEELFEQRRDLFSEIDLVFFDTTSIYFEGEGGQEIGRHGKSKDHRPDLKQMVVGLALDLHGWPLCCELWPGNTADVTTLLPVVNRLQQRFRVRRVPESCMMAAAAACAGAEAVHKSRHRRGFPWRDSKGLAADITIYHLWHECGQK